MSAGPEPSGARRVAEAPLPPHPKDLPAIGSMADFARDILGTISRGWRAHGDVVRFRGLNEMCLVAHPEHVKHVLEDRLDIYPRSEPVKKYLRPIVGQGLLISEGELWNRQRRMVAPLVHDGQAGGMAAGIAAAAAACVDRLSRAAQRREPVDVRAEMTALGIDMIARAILGPGRGPALAAQVASAIEYAGPRVMMPINPPDRLTPPGRRYLRTLREMDQALAAEIPERRRAAAPGSDLLSLLARARDPESGEAMPDARVRDEALTAAFGMYKGVPAGLTWGLYLLAQHPEAEKALRAELDGVLAGRGPGAADLPRLRYTRMVVDETLRLYPPLWIFSRPAGEDDLIGGYRITKGVFVLIIPYVTHRHPAFWEKPEAFDPGRFAPETAAARHPYAYIPFGGGARRCAGDEVGPMAVCLALASILQRYRPRLAGGTELAQSLEFLLRPRKALPMVLEPA
jgi:cytochrome P450